jgi:predicted nucleotidyltransferase
MNLIESNIERLRLLCQKHKVGKLFVFGSVLSNRFNVDSDIDLIVHFNEVDLSDYADNYFTLKDELEKLFNRKVDLLEAQAIRNPFFKESIDQQKRLVYGSSKPIWEMCCNPLTK